MPNQTVDDFLMDAKRVVFFTPAQNDNIAAVFILFENFNTSAALYKETVRLNKIYPQYLGFKKSHSSIILSFIIASENRAHAKMLLDYDGKEFDEFIKVVEPTSHYVVLFGQIVDGQRRISTGTDNSFWECSRYVLE